MSPKYRTIHYTFTDHKPHVPIDGKWIEYATAVALNTAFLSKDKSTKVGAVLMCPTTKRLVAAGYNGYQRGLVDDDIAANDRYDYTIHAEMNAILACGEYGISTRDKILFTTHKPCKDCLKHIGQAGINLVIYISATTTNMVCPENSEITKRIADTLEINMVCLQELIYN